MAETEEEINVLREVVSSLRMKLAASGAANQEQRATASSARSELLVAQARIEELEEQVAQLRAELRTYKLQAGKYISQVQEQQQKLRRALGASIAAKHRRKEALEASKDEGGGGDVMEEGDIENSHRISKQRAHQVVQEMQAAAATRRRGAKGSTPW